MSTHARQLSIASSINSTSHNHPQKIGPWKLGKTLGRGATGRVLLATHQTTGQKAAVKVVSKSELQEDDNGKKADDAGLPYGIEREIIIMKLLTHPNVLRLYDVWETSKALYLVLEYVEGGELFDLLVERGPLQEVEAIKYFRQIILGTAYCHALGICHRDLKPENLLLDASLNVKLADFGMAALESNGKLLETSCGSPHYAAPEIVSGLKYHGAASDVWSCGVILFALLTGTLPFDDENIRNLLLKVQAGNFEMPSEISYEAQDLITKMLCVDPIERIQTDHILAHPLLNKYPIPNEDLISVKSLPHPETAYKSLGSVKNIDKQILSNLAILWHDRPEDDIVQCLLKNGPNPEKTFYALLMRYRHNQDDHINGTPKKSTSRRNLNRSGSNSAKDTPKRKRASQIAASRPTSFQYRNNNRASTSNTRQSAASSVNNSPIRGASRRINYSPQGKRSTYSQSPIKSPNKSPRRNSQFGSSSLIPAIPRNIYNEIVSVQGNTNSVNTNPISLPPPLPSKDTILLDSAQLEGTPSKSNKRRSIIGRSVSKNRLSKRKSLRASMTNGLKRNSITMKLLSTYAKVSGETDWEYMDKQTKRTSATFATLCDKIFNQETYDEDEEKLIDEEEKQAKEYERLMEIERKKHEAELKARKELEKRQKRQKRKSLMSSRKLSILVKQDPNNSGEIEAEEAEILQPKRRLNLRSVSEAPHESNDILTSKEVADLKKRSVTQPVNQRRSNPILTRRPVSRLDPLWIAYENEELTRAKEALDEELKDSKSHKNSKKNSSDRRSSRISKKEADFNKRESVISILDDNDKGSLDFQKEDYELPEPNMDDSDLSKEYLSEIRKSRLLNSQLNINGIVKNENNSTAKQQTKTLIGDVKIPNVTRKSRCFTNSNKRLSVLTMYSTKDSYRDLNSILQGEKDVEDLSNMPKLRTSFADRLDRAGLNEDVDDEEPLDEGSIMDFDEHLANKRTSYYDVDRRNSKIAARRNSRLPKSQVPELPEDDDHRPNQLGEEEEETFVTKNDEVRHSSNRNQKNNQNDVFDSIKLPDGKTDNRNATSSSKQKQSSRKTKSMLPSAESMLLPDPDIVNSFDSGYSELNGVKNRQLNEKHKPTAKHNQDAFATPDSTTETIPPMPPAHTSRKPKPLDDATNKPTALNQTSKKNKSIFRKLSWGSKKALENNQLPSPDDSGNEKPKSSFFGWFSSSEPPTANEIKRFNTLLPKHEMTSALFALLNSWSNFGLKNLKNDQVGYNITGAVSNNNAFNLKSCKFRIKINPRAFNQKSEIVCARVKGSKVTTDTLFKEIEKVLVKEGVMDS